MIPADQMAATLEALAAGTTRPDLVTCNPPMPPHQLRSLLGAYGWPSPARMTWHAQALRDGFDNATPTHTTHAS